MTKTKLGPNLVDEKKAQEGFVAVTVVGDEAASPSSSRKMVATHRRQNKPPLTAAQRLCLRIFVAFLTIAAIVLAVLGGYYIYKSVHYSKGYKGNCKVFYEGSSESNAQIIDEDVDIDDNRETINVPKFDDSDEATFIHDFSQEVSLIKDKTDRVCYILPLNKDLIPPPRDFFDLLMGLQNGDYIYKADKIRSDYMVVQPKIEDQRLRELYGDYIADSCVSFESYELKEVDTQTTTTTAMPTLYYQRRFVMFPGGQALLEYYIFK